MGFPSIKQKGRGTTVGKKEMRTNPDKPHLSLETLKWHHPDSFVYPDAISAKRIKDASPNKKRRPYSSLYRLK